MVHYKNLNGNSNVIAYDIGDSSITVRFADLSAYLYDYTRAGKAHVDQMKRLALAGRGLNSYIKTRVDRLYTRKI